MLHVAIFATLALSQAWQPRHTNCEKVSNNRWYANFGHLAIDPNKERVKLNMDAGISYLPNCPAEDFSGSVRITRDEDCQRVIQECGFGQGEEPQCLGKRRSFTQLLHDGTTHDGNKWHTYYVCRHRTPVEGAEVLLYEAFREIKALWDVDGAHMTSENKCTEALAKENSFLLERRLVYDKGVLCTGFRNLDLLEIPPHLLVKQDAGDDHVAMTVVTRPEVPHLTRYAGDGPVMTVGAAFLLANTRRPVQKGVWSAIGCSCGEASHSECFCGAGTAASIDVLLRLVLVVLLL